MVAMPTQWYVVMDIGCLECGYETDLIGVFDHVPENVTLRHNMGQATTTRWAGSGVRVAFPIKIPFHPSPKQPTGEQL